MTRQPGRYTWLALVAGTALSIALSILVNVQLAQNARDAQRDAVCDIARTQLGIYRAEAPITPAGKESERAWRDAYYYLWKCEESPRGTTG